MTPYERAEQTLLLSIDRASQKVLSILPEALLAFALLIAGLIIAAAVHFLAVRLMAFFAVDKLAAKTPLHRMLRGVGIEKGPSEILALLLFWLTILLTLFYVSEVLHLRQVSTALGLIARYVPQVIIAFLIIVFGALLAKFLQSFAVQTSGIMHTGYEKSIGAAVQTLVLVFVFLAAFQQLGVELGFITTSMVIGLSSVLVVAGIGLIVSARAILENALACSQLRRHVRIGQTVEIEGHIGIIEGFTLTSVLLREDRGKAVLPAAVFFRTSYILGA